MAAGRREFLAKFPALAVGTAAFLESQRSSVMAQESPARQGVEREFLDFQAQDGKRTWGLYYRPKGKNPKTAVIIMHPHDSTAEHFLTTRLAEQGYAVLGQNNRWLNNDLDGIQEATMLDIAAGIQFLKKNYGVGRIVCVGHSGGGGLFALYQAQAAAPPPGRLSATPAGDPPDLNQFDLPPLDGYIGIAAHKGQGIIFSDRLDPAVVDESDPVLTDWTLDMYDARNGFRKPPEPSKYSQDFLVRYRAAQLERARRLDAKAYAMIARQRQALERMKSSDFARLAPGEQRAIEQAASDDGYMIIYRTAADPRMTDLSIDPSDRRAVIGTDPAVIGFASGGVSRVMSARGFLSTRSRFSTRMLTDENLAKVKIPTLVVGATADISVLGLETIRTSYQAAAAEGKTLSWVKGADHGFGPGGPAAGGRDTRAEVTQIIVEWLRPRFPS